MDIIWGLLGVQQHLDTVIAQHGALTYAILFGVVFCEMGLLPLFFLPGDPLLFFAGALCASAALNLWLLMPVLFIAAVLGSSLNYYIGGILGRKLGPRVFSAGNRWLDEAALLKTQAFYEKHGRIAFLLSPFIVVVRTFMPFIAGVSTMEPRKFALDMTAGAAIWVVAMVVGGYFFGNIPIIRTHLSLLVLGGIALGLGSLALSAGVRAYKAKSRQPS